MIPWNFGLKLASKIAAGVRKSLGYYRTVLRRPKLGKALRISGKNLHTYIQRIVPDPALCNKSFIINTKEGLKARRKFSTMD